jgi:type I restriction enzyme R subunit
VYFDNQIGIIEVEAQTTEAKKKQPPKVAEGSDSGGGSYQFDILKIIEARNDQEAVVGSLIKDFEGKIQELFEFVRQEDEGKRLIVKINSHKVSESEIYSDFAKLYRRFRALRKKTVGDYFFKETEDLVEKLCDDFEVTVNLLSKSENQLN